MKKLLIVLLIVLIFSGCAKIGVENAAKFLPPNAIVLTDHGNGWIEFELEGNVFLFNRVKLSYGGLSSITQIK